MARIDVERGVAPVRKLDKLILERSKVAYAVRKVGIDEPPVRLLPIISIGSKSYYVDDRLEQFRNVHDPFDYITFQQFDQDAETVFAGAWERW